MSAKAALLLGVTVLTISASLVLDDGGLQRDAPFQQEYQHLVGGLGFGPAVDFSQGGCRFDPRLCSYALQWPETLTVGGQFDSGFSIFYYPALRNADRGGE